MNDNALKSRVGLSESIRNSSKYMSRILQLSIEIEADLQYVKKVQAGLGPLLGKRDSCSDFPQCFDQKCCYIF